MAVRWPRFVPLLACLYLPFIGGGLLTDDFAHIEHLTHIDSPARLLDRPDTFGFYRPVAQATLAAEIDTHGRPAGMRAFNLLLHAAVIALAFLVARLVLESSFAAGLAALAFALTPKAPPIAVLWISARGELLMALFTLVAVAAWIVWTRGGRPVWLAAAGLAFALALTSKEAAAVLPVLLALTPRPERSLTSRAVALTGLLVIAAAIFMWRAHTGALTPFSGDAHYDLMAPLSVWVRNGINYSGRIPVAPLALVAVVAIAVSIRRRAEASASAGTRTLKRALYGETSVAVFSLAWVVMFLVPVLPIALRSELYLYLPVFGLCVLVGEVAERLVQRVNNPRIVMAAIGMLTLVFAGYQIARARERHHDLVFSEKLVEALLSTPQLAGRGGRVLLLPSDTETERRLQDTIGGYFYLVLEYAHHNPRLTGDVQYRGDAPRQASLRLTCVYREDRGTVTLSPAP